MRFSIEGIRMQVTEDLYEAATKELRSVHRHGCHIPRAHVYMSADNGMHTIKVVMGPIEASSECPEMHDAIHSVKPKLEKQFEKKFGKLLKNKHKQTKHTGETDGSDNT